MLTNFQWAKYEKNTVVHSNNVLQKLKKKKAFNQHQYEKSVIRFHRWKVNKN